MARVIQPDGHEYILGMGESLVFNMNKLMQLVKGPIEVMELDDNHALVFNADLMIDADPESPNLNISAGNLLNRMFSMVMPVMGTVVLLDLDDALFMSKGL